MVKIDTREKYHVIRILQSENAANLAAELDQQVGHLLRSEVRNLVVNLSDIRELDANAAQFLHRLGASALETGASFVLCGLQPGVRTAFARLGWEPPHAPTESEASDIVLMEEFERELGAGDEP